LAWGGVAVDDVAPILLDAEVSAIEVAPTVIWPDLDAVLLTEATTYRHHLAELGLRVSGLQSLLFGHPELQLFDRSCWPAMTAHLSRALRLAGALEARVAVFGSPRNRVRGDLPIGQAHEVASEFFTGLLPVLADSGVILTLEPNAPAYGADYLVTYAEVVELAARIGSPWVRPQVDTGCLAMVDDDWVDAVALEAPAHVHVSAPRLVPPPAGLDHRALAARLRSDRYAGWVVLEMLPVADSPQEALAATLQWMSGVYGDGARG
jgi:sugar phosphate isomerase/epimerase